MKGIKLILAAALALGACGGDTDDETIVCPGNTRLENGRCVCIPDACEAGVCNEATGECVEDRCEGVSCAGDAVCDPLDGLCRCEGSLCEADQICDAGICVPLAETCDGEICPAGAVCNPSTLQCHCGDENGPVCFAGFVCDGFSCVNEACRDVLCSQGMSCDPSDGVCKCGTEICTAGEVCQAGVCTPED